MGRLGFWIFSPPRTLSEKRPAALQGFRWGFAAEVLRFAVLLFWVSDFFGVGIRGLAFGWGWLDVFLMAGDFLDRFGGVGRIYGGRVLEGFGCACVVVVGIGGVGSWTVEALARSGVGRIRLVDLDEICVSNVNRQLHAMDGQIGRQKTAAMLERVRLINPGCEVEVVEGFFTERSVEEVLGGDVDGVVDAIDSMKHKALLLAECVRRGIPVVTCGGAGGKRDATRIVVRDLAFSGKDALLHGLRKKLRKEFGFAKVEMGKKPVAMGISAVFSDEDPIYPGEDGEVSCDRPEGVDVRLNCASGYGTVAHVTGAFGLVAAGEMLGLLARD